MASIRSGSLSLVGYVVEPRTNSSILLFAVLGAIVGFSTSTVLANAGVLSSTTIPIVTITTAIIVGSVPVWHTVGVFTLVVSVMFPIYLLRRVIADILRI